MEQLEKHLIPSSQTVQRKTVTLIGPGGIGKTRLCSEFTRRHQHRFDGVVWLDGGNESRLKQSLAAVACRIPSWQLPQTLRTESGSSISSVDTLASDVLGWLSAPENNRWLVIFDNVKITLAS